MVVIGAMVFIGAMALACAVIWLSIAPQWRRVVSLATGHAEKPFQPLGALAHAERRIAVKRWATTSAPSPAQWRAAA